VKPISRISRIVRVLATLQSGQDYTTDDLAGMLGKSRRTIFRDLKDIQQAGIPIYYDKIKHSYTIDQKFFMPPINLNAQEVLSLFLLIFRSHLNSPFKNSALFAGHKIESNISRDLRKYCNEALQHISVGSKPQVKVNLHDDRFAQLLKAIMKKKIMNIHYYLPMKREIIITDLYPYHLRHDGFQWCLIGKSLFHEEIYTFNINQIREMNVLDKCFIMDKEFDLNEYLGRAWSKKPEGRLYHVKLKFTPDTAYSVAEVQWHNTQKVTFQEDGSAIIEFRIDGLREIIWWVLGYGDKVKVLAPEVLQKRIAQMARNMLKNYEQK